MSARRHAAGLTLVELLVSLAIGSFLVIAGVRTFANARAVYRAAESVAGLQEAARYALAAFAYEIEHAGFYGLTNRADRIVGRTSRPADPAITVGNDCGEGWALDLDVAIGGANNGYDWDCNPYGNRAAALADTLTVRRVEPRAVTVWDAGRLYVRTTRFGNGQVFVGPAPAAFTEAPSATHELSTRGYYVSETSSLSTPGNLVPSLRVKTLTRGAAGPRVVDEEIHPGIEDMQIELGIDRDTPGSAGFDAIEAYVAPGSAELVGARILAVRVWLLVRGVQRENGFTASPARTYADRTLAAHDDRYRRTLVSATVFARNASRLP